MYQLALLAAYGKIERKKRPAYVRDPMRTRTGCCISIPMIFAIDLNSRQYAKIGSTPDDALQVCLYTEPYAFKPSCEFGYGYVGESCGEKGEN